MGAMLKDIFRFPDFCLGHANANPITTVGGTEGSHNSKGDTKATASAIQKAVRDGDQGKRSRNISSKPH